MYDPDCPIIAEFAAKSPANTFKVGLFVLSTINQHFEYVPGILKNFARYGLDCKNYTRMTKLAIKELSMNQYGIFEEVQAWKDLEFPEHQALRFMVEQRGFGIVKAAFFVQMVLPFCRIGCLDRHNITMYGLRASAFSHKPTSVFGLTSKLNVYIALCEQLGGPAILWNNWCAWLSKLRPQSFASAEAVSQLHVSCILGEN